MEWIDFHAHHPLEPNVYGIQNLDTLKEESVLANNFYSVGWHPWYVDAQWADNFLVVEKLAALTSVKAIGECGFDKFKGDKRFQEDVFYAHVRLSELLAKPLIIHSVGGSDKILMMNSTIKPIQPWIIHSFVGSLHLADELVKRGIYISVGPHSLRSDKTKEVIARFPLNQLFIETDDRELGIEEVYQTLAQIRGIQLDVLRETMAENFKKIIQI